MIMGRENCMMCNFIGNEMYCDYYDFAFMKCSEKSVCPDGLDDDDEDEWPDNDYDYESEQEY